jgi:hypothetical protein
MSVNRKTAKAVTLIGAAVILSVLPTLGVGQSQTRPAPTFTCITKPETPEEPEAFRAVIFVRNGNAWRRIDLPEQYEFASWEYAGRVKSKRDVWAIAQFGHGDIGPDLEIAHSLNDGRSWRHHSLTKISRFAGFESLSMAGNGRGSLTIRLQDSPDPEHQDGYYTYETRNNGRTWSRKPRYSKTAPPASPTTLEPIAISSGPCLGPGQKPSP